MLMSEAYGHPAVDTHTHLNHPRLLRRLEQVLARAREAGVGGMLVVGYDVPSSETAVRLAEAHPHLWAAVGVHPHDAVGADARAMGRLRELAQSRKVVAVGETGLDFYRDLSPREAQVEAFRRHLALAGELQRPVVVHCRDAQEEVLSILQQYHGLPCIWHCFDGSREQAEAALALGALLGFTGIVTYRGSEKLRQVAAAVPADRLLLETDSPYLAPEPRRKGDNEPANLPLVAASVAEVRGTDPGEMMRQVTQNARRVFGLPREESDE